MQARASTDSMWPIDIPLVVLFAMMAAGITLVTQGDSATTRLLLYFTVFAVLAPLSGIIAFASCRSATRRPKLSFALSVAVSLAVAMGWIETFIRETFEAKDALIAATAGMALLAMALIEHGHSRSPRWFVRIVAFTIIVIALIGAALSVKGVDGNLNWIQTLNAHLGPALRVTQGGIPMIDVFCQYGLLPYLLFSAAFTTLFSPSYPAGAFVVALVNASYIAVAASILLKSNKSMIVVAAAVVVLTAFIVPSWSGIPASGGFRFLPPLLVCLGLAVHGDKRVSISGLITLVVGSFWSIEGFAWCFAVFFSTLALRLAYERASFMEWIRDIGTSLLALALTQLLFAGSWLVIFGSLPRYDIYLDMIKSYGANGWGDVAFSTTSQTWLLAGMLYFSAVGLAVNEVIKGKNPNSHFGIVEIAFPVGMTGIVTLFYWVGRPLEFNLLPTIVPAVVLGALVVDQLCLRMLLIYWRRTETFIPLALYCLVSGSILGYAYQLGVGSVRLDVKHYLTDKAAAISLLITRSAADWSYDPVILGAAQLIIKHQPQDPQLTLFVRLPRDIPIFLLTRKFDIFGRSNQNDEISKKLMEQTLKTAMTQIKPGSIVFLEAALKDFLAGRRGPTSATDTFTPFIYTAYLALTEAYDLCTIDRNSVDVVATVVRKKPASCDKFND